MGENKIMYRIAILKNDGKTLGKNFKDREEAQDYILDIAEKEGVKRAILLNKKTNKREIIKELE